MNISSIQIDYSRPDDEKKKYSGQVYLEKPFQKKTGEWACNIFILIDEKKYEIFGGDSLQALTLSLDFLKHRLEDFKTKGFKLYFKNSEEEFCTQSYFGN